MKLADDFREALAGARHRCGPIITTTVEALGYVIVPAPFVASFIRLLTRDDERQEPTPCARADQEKP